MREALAAPFFACHDAGRVHATTASAALPCRDRRLHVAHTSLLLLLRTLCCCAFAVAGEDRGLESSESERAKYNLLRNVSGVAGEEVKARFLPS